MVSKKSVPIISDSDEDAEATNALVKENELYENKTKSLGKGSVSSKQSVSRAKKSVKEPNKQIPDEEVALPTAPGTSCTSVCS